MYHNGASILDGVYEVVVADLELRVAA